MKLIHLFYRTLRKDWKIYNKSERPFTVRRLTKTLYTRIHSPVFIIGAPRSGTTVLTRCLHFSPAIGCHYEPIITKYLSKHVYNRTYPFVFLKQMYRLVYRWLTKIHLDSDIRFAEKTPRNCFILNFLDEIYPNAQFIHIIRDGRDVALSLSKKPWFNDEYESSGLKEPGGYRYGPYPRFWVEKHRRSEFQKTSNIHRCIWSWRRHVESAREFSKKLPSSRYLEIRYERFVARPELTYMDLAAFLNINRGEDIMQNCIKQLNDHSVHKWKKELSPSELSEIELEAGHLLKNLEYL